MCVQVQIIERTSVRLFDHLVGATERGRRATLIASSRARSLPTFPFRRRRSMSWSSILRPPRRSAFRYHNHCCLVPTRWSN